MSALLTDLYQLTMAQGYFLCGRARDEAVFHLFFRKLPFSGGYAVAAGLDPVLDFVASFRFDEDDTRYLARLTGADGAPLFRKEFLEYLRGLRLSIDIDAMPEGTLVFAQEPLLRVRGRLLEAQLLETALLNLINFQTLIATKAARVCEAAAGAPVLEMGLRRAQGVDGALAASRAAYLGGCSATSNVLAGKRYGIPVRGTHAHSWVMAFDHEIEAFQAYADVMPNNSLFLVDTYDTLAGVRNAIEVAKDLRARGHDLLGVRLDSGDLAWLSTRARALLDEAGFDKAAIVGTNDLDEHLIESLRHQGAAIAVWGVGTKLVTAYDQPALGGVYKLSMIGPSGGPLQPRMKLSEDPAKMSSPGIQQVRRYADRGLFVADAIYDEQLGIEAPASIVDPLNTLRRRELAATWTHEDLLLPVVRAGRLVAERPSLEVTRQKLRAELGRLDPTIKRLVNPHVYPVGLESKLFDARLELYRSARAAAEQLNARQA